MPTPRRRHPERFVIRDFKAELSALEFAASEGRIRDVERLIEAGSTIGMALFEAVDQDHRDIAELLLRYGADVNDMAGSGRTPLFVAATRGNADLCQWLIDHGADARVIDAGGETVLFKAACAECADTLLVLLRAGAPLDHLDSCGRSVQEMVVEIHERIHLDLREPLENALHRWHAVGRSDRLDEAFEAVGASSAPTPPRSRW